MMKVHEVARMNMRKHGAYNDCSMTLTNPKMSVGYGRVLLALKVLAPEYRKTQMQVAKLIGRPIRHTTTYTKTGNLTTMKYFATHGAWASLSNAQLIAKVDGTWTITELGERYLKEMHFA